MINSAVWTTLALLCDAWQLTGQSAALFSRQQGSASCSENKPTR